MRVAAGAAVVALVLAVGASMVWPETMPRLGALPKPSMTSCDWIWSRGGGLFWHEQRSPRPSWAKAEDGTMYHRTLDADCGLVDDQGHPITSRAHRPMG